MDDMLPLWFVHRPQFKSHRTAFKNVGVCIQNQPVAAVDIDHNPVVHQHPFGQNWTSSAGQVVQVAPFHSIARDVVA